MTTITSYLTFEGNCREAMTFYKQCLGGKLSFQTLGKSPFGTKLPGNMRRYILNATLVQGKLAIIGSDLVPETGLTKGNAVSMLLHCSSAKDVAKYFARLSADGRITAPLVNTSQGSLFGSLVDKYGNHWLLSYQDIKRKTPQRRRARADAENRKLKLKNK